MRKPGGGPAPRDHRPKVRQLLDLHFGARFFQLLLGRVSVGFRSAFQHGLGRAFHQRLGFRQAETGFDFAKYIDLANYTMSKLAPTDSKGQTVVPTIQVVDFSKSVQK